MSEESLINIEGQPSSWCMGSFINWLRSGRLNLAIKGSMGAARMVPETVPLDVTTRGTTRLGSCTYCGSRHGEDMW